MRSPIGAVIERLRNAAPVPLGPTSVGNLTLGAAMRGQQDDERYMSAYGSVGVIFAMVSRIAGATSAPDWHLYRSSKTGNPDDRVEVTKHAALDLWNKPNPFMPQQEFIECMQQHVDLTGEADWIIGRSGNFSVPLELWPVRPDRITPVPDPYAFLRGYVYTGPEGQTMPLELNECVQLKMPNPLDPYRGMGPVQSILVDLDSTRYAAEWNRNFFLNSATPGGIIQVDRRLDDTEFDEMSKRWAEQHRGVNKAHRVAILEAGTWVDRQFSMKDMQFAELRELSNDQIMLAFGFPRPILGITEAVNRANADAAEYLFSKWLIVPRLERIKAALNTELLPMFGATAKGLEFDYDSPVSDDTDGANMALTARSTAVSLLVPLGYDPAETLEAVGLPPIKFEKPAPPPAPVIAPPGAKPLPDQAGSDGAPPGGNDGDEQNNNRYINAMRWVVEAHIDDHTCQPCLDNDGKLYRNRADAYADYPDGTSYVDCVGEEFGNHCRCVVKKRRADDAS